MAKKKKQPPSTSPSAPSSSAAPPSSPVPVTPAAADAEAARLDAAFGLGNFSMVRQLAATASTAEAKVAADRLMALVRVEKEQVIVGLIGLAVVLLAAALTLS